MKYDRHTNLSAERKFPKLVRDRIIEIMEAKGERPKWEKITTKREFVKFLLKKLMEESAEANHAVLNGNLKEELADLMEIIDEILKIKGWTLKTIRKLQKDKRQTNGGFKEKIKLIERKKII